ncbi:enoyl-CoA hydratase/carnithine racemase [Mycobacterium sp. OAS707]|uniref:hypothetical protein n=1 Tax=Mycobacterium sp. OAS707 TaxID=2663822 RepID=UPI001A0FAC1E|nr:hypothetical protein [Mycobacterium sp. OAS707]MBE1547337.1 enoyl-CoA hydratase/carnithine racemase [Mycobacterium sp. OAS707]
MSSTRISVTRRSPAYWRVTFDHPPLNIFGPESSLELGRVIADLENDEDVKVVVFDSAVDGFFLTHYDFDDRWRSRPGYRSARPVCSICLIFSPD